MKYRSPPGEPKEQKKTLKKKKAIHNLKKKIASEIKLCSSFSKAVVSTVTNREKHFPLKLGSVGFLQVYCSDANISGSIDCVPTEQMFLARKTL